MAWRGVAGVTRTVGVESEMELAYAGLHQFCGAMMGSLERLPGPQREALEVAFGLRRGEAPDRFLVGLAVLGLLSEAAKSSLSCSWSTTCSGSDEVSAQTLAFVGRRLLAERVALVFAVRDRGDGGALAGLAELIVRGLPEADARALLETVVPGPVDERVREPDRGGDPWQPACVDRVAAWLDPRATGGGVRASRLDAVGEQYRAKLCSATRRADCQHSTAVARGCSRSARGFDPVVGRCGAVRHRHRHGRRRRGDGTRGDRFAGSVSPPARAFRGLPVRVRAGTPHRAPRPCRRHRRRLGP